MAKVMALYDFQVNELGRKRDFFTAFNVSATLNSMRAKDSDHIFTPEEILRAQYREYESSVTVTHNPDLGAITDDSLRVALKGHV